MTDNKLAKELLKMKETAEKASQEALELKGRIKQIQATLKEEYQCDDIDEAESLLIQSEEQAKELEDEIEEGLAEVKEIYDF